MKIGIVFPQAEIGNDPAGIKDFAQAAEALGYHHVLLYDHVLGVDPGRPGGWRGPYDKDTAFHEVFVTLGFLAAHTTRIELAIGVVILPQRQTALVAKQAAELDLLSRGRLRLGVGTGWNAVEYEALGQDFTQRGPREAEQVGLIRDLWTHDAIDFAGTWDRVPHAGINPRPARRIPIWFGGSAEPVLQRMARLGDGWMTNLDPTDDARAALARLRGYCEAEGRDVAAFGIDAQIGQPADGLDTLRAHAAGWRALGATHASVRSMGAGLSGPRPHIKALSQYKDVLEF